VPIEGTPLRMEMVTCTAEGIHVRSQHFAVRDPAAVSAAIDAVKAASVANLGGTRAENVCGFQLAGMTPNPRPARLEVTGRRPDGEAVDLHAAFFTRGLRIYQLSVLGKAPPPQVGGHVLRRTGFSMTGPAAEEQPERMSTRLALWLFLSFAFAYFFSALLRGVTATLAPNFSAELG
jgi:hypothetical protein